MDERLNPDPADGDASDSDRRDFIRKAGKLALVAPPAITFLLTTSLSSTAIAVSNQTSRQVLRRGYDQR